MKSRLKNPYFWVGLIGVILTAMGIKPESLTSWGLVVDSFIEMIKNPFMLFTVALAVLGVFVDPSTKGLKDHKYDEVLLEDVSDNNETDFIEDVSDCNCNDEEPEPDFIENVSDCNCNDEEPAFIKKEKQM